ncbi:hypothetical protein [uncultured Mitsuokella sp.]|uniref:hypothetical protein n=1 Tax=uncultured Mitsuokella sp. TaxID=453120 RepID=UPI0026DCE540|nr:hypothetical protein [uncultured Mitsuokella sp.]
MNILLTIAHVFAYAIIQTFGFTLFTLALQRLGRLQRLYRLKALLFLVMVNAAGTMTFGEAAWGRTSTPVAAGLFLIGMAFFLAAHFYLGWKKLRR